MEYKLRLRTAAEEGLLLFVKFALLIGLIILVTNWLTNVTQGANNGTQSAIYINLLQNKGLLPKIQNGQVMELPNAKVNSNELINTK